MRAALALVIGLLLAPPPAAAQNPFAPALTVNDSVVTNHDIAQRQVFLEALGATGDLRAIAIEQLTDDRLRLQAAAELGIEITDELIETGVEEFAAQRGITVENVEQVLAARGIDRQTLEDFVEAGVLWREVVTARFRARAMPSEADIDAALGTALTTPQDIVTIAEIALPFAERGDAETVELADRIVNDIRRGAMSFGAAVGTYSRSQSAETGGRLPPIPASQLPPEIRGQILLMRPGEVTNPLPISGGLAILQLVALSQAPPAASELSEPEQREALREQLFGQRINSFQQGYLQELRRDAIIVER